MNPKSISVLFEQAALAELEALKPGNVHIYAAGHGMTLNDFVISARVTAPLLVATDKNLGKRILDATLAIKHQTHPTLSLIHI